MTTRKSAAKEDLEELTAGEQYFAKRCIRLFGVSYKPGDRIPTKTIDSLPRVESLLRTGLLSKG